MQLRRALVLHDGSVLCAFTADTHATHTIVLEPSGHAYTYVHPNGTMTRHLTPTALSSHRPMVVTAMRIRNRYTTTPYAHASLLVSKPFRIHQSTRKARWPSPTSHFDVAQLWNPQEQVWEMQSMDANASVRLHGHGRLVEISHNVVIKQSVDSLEASVTRVQQTFPIENGPEAFNFPLSILQHAQECRRRNEKMFQLPEVNQHAVTSELPSNAAFDARPSFTEATRWTQYELSRVATLPSQALCRQLAVEVQPEMTTYVVSPTKLYVSADTTDQVLEYDRGFLSLINCRGDRTHRFTMESIPPTSFGERSMAFVCQHLQYLHRAVQQPPTPAPSVQQEFTASKRLVNEAQTPDSSRFRAYADGTIRVVFHDRTIVQVDLQSQLIAIFSRDGQTSHCTLTSVPADYQAQIDQAMAFADWAFASPAQRMERHVTRLQSQAMIQQELQRIHVQCHMNAAFPEQEQDQEPHDKRPRDSSVSISLPFIRDVTQQTQAHLAAVQKLLNPKQ